MKTPKKQTKPESKKRDYTKPELKKRERIKEVTEGNDCFAKRKRSYEKGCLPFCGVKARIAPLPLLKNENKEGQVVTDSDKFRRYKEIYTKFIHGTNCLNKQMAAGVNVDRKKRVYATCSRADGCAVAYFNGLRKKLLV